MAIDISELRKLPASEKLRIVELLWDDIAASNEAIELHEWQFEEAKRRSEEVKKDPSLSD